jgi:hypothetical protein
MTKIERGAVIRTANAWDGITTGAGTATVAAAALAAGHTPMLEVMIQCNTGSPESVFVGNQHGQYFEVVAGANVVIPVNDLSTVYIRSAAGTGTYNYIAAV